MADGTTVGGTAVEVGAGGVLVGTAVAVGIPVGTDGGVLVGATVDEITLADAALLEIIVEALAAAVEALPEVAA
ncbi:MAG: hypothetical protein M1118_01855 [Chloroflexi bacterium]|nr:hypothetical protein [Chloroflexota bacterium]